VSEEERVHTLHKLTRTDVLLHEFVIGGSQETNVLVICAAPLRIARYTAGKVARPRRRPEDMRGRRGANDFRCGVHLRRAERHSRHDALEKRYHLCIDRMKK